MLCYLAFDSQKLVGSMYFKLEMPCLGARDTVNKCMEYNLPNTVEY